MVENLGYLAYFTDAANLWPVGKVAWHSPPSPLTPSARLLQRMLPLAVLGLSVISVPVMIFSPTGLPRLRSLTEEKSRVDVEVSRLGDQIRMLRTEVHHVKDDPAKVEQVARDQLGLVRQTELVFQFAE
jgi:cell division protein FtsB